MAKIFYSPQGRSCSIKVSKKFIELDEASKQHPAFRRVIVKFREKDTLEWMYHSPDADFMYSSDVVHYLLNHLETEGMEFKIVPATTSKGY